MFPAVTEEGRSIKKQALYQLAALGVCLAFAAIGGIITGINDGGYV